VLVGIAFAVFWGTIFPVLTETFRGVRVSVGPPFYNEVNVPLGLALLALTGICPLLAWRKASSRNLRRNFLYPVMATLATAGILLLIGLTQPVVVVSLSLAVFVFFSIGLEFYRGTKARVRVTGQSPPLALWNLVSRNKRRYGGYIVHLGVILMIIGITGSNAFKQEQEALLTPGDSLQIGDYTLIYRGLVDHSTDRAQIVAAEMRVELQDRYLKTLYPSKQFFPNQDPISEVDIRQTLKEDLYLILSGWDKTGRASIKALINPLVVWIWTGGMVMLIGTLIALGPQRVKKLGNLPVTTFEGKAVEVSHV
jgi:cytochrome c-type biogenesis protein CcmF